MEKVKYARTRHIPSSPGATDDDKRLKDLSCFHGKEVFISEKMDGECTSGAKTYTHARSLDSNNHPSRNYVKGIFGGIQHLIPEGWRICGENLYAQHSIPYENLESYFYCFNIWDENNICLSLDDTLEWRELLGLTFVPILYRGIFDETILNNLIENLDLEKQEGIVIRITDSFHYKDFKTSIAKWVRKGHVQTDEHWLNQPIIPNKLKNK